LLSRYVTILAVTALLLAGAARALPAPVPAEGTLGTEILLTGGGFGDRKGSVRLVFDDGSKPRRLKVRRRDWTETSVRCVLKKVKKGTGGRSGRIVLRPKGGTPEIDLGAFHVRPPEIRSAPLSGRASDELTISGLFFGKKRGKLLLAYDEDGREIVRRMKIKSWEMDPETGESTAVSVVPKKIVSGTQCKIRIESRVGPANGESLFVFDPPEVDAPGVAIVWPPSASLTQAGTIEVRGTTNSPVGISELRVAGVAAESDDGFLTWRVTVGVPAGVTLLHVETVDMFGNVDSDAASFVVRSTGRGLDSPFVAAYDPAGGRALAVTLLEPALLSIDAETGARTLVSGEDRGAGPGMVGPTGLAVDAPRARAYVVDAAAGAILRVALGSGDGKRCAPGGIGRRARIRAGARGPA
jgi:hypothetical protein